MTLQSNSTKYLIGFVIGFILAAVLTCNGGKRTIPEVRGVLVDKEPIIHTKYITKEKPVIKYIPYKVIDTIEIAGETIIIQPLDTLETKQYEKTYEDAVVKITAKGIVTGRVESLQIDYTRKEFEVKAVEKSINVLLGGEVQINPSNQNAVFQAGVMLQFKNGNALKAGYDSQKNWSAGYYVNVFK